MKTTTGRKQPLLCLAVLGFTLVNAQADIIRGSSREQVVRELGRPDSTLKIGASETYVYKSGISITLRNDLVQEMTQRGQIGPVTVITGQPTPPLPGSASIPPTVAHPQPAPGQSLLPNGTGLWPSAPGDGMNADRFGDTYPFAYNEPPRDVLDNHQTYWLDSTEFYYFANVTFFKSPEYKTNEQQLLVYYFRLEKPDERKKVEADYQQTQHSALSTHPRFNLYMLLVHLDRANRDYGKARDIFIKTEGLSFAKPFPLDAPTKPESRPLHLMLKDALARMYYCRTRLAKEFPTYCDQDKAYAGITEFNTEYYWRKIANKTECPWTDPGWSTYSGEIDIINNDYLGRDDARLIRGRRVTGPNATGQTNWFIVKNHPQKDAPRLNTGIVQARLLRCKSLGNQSIPGPLADRIGQRELELLDFGAPAETRPATKQIMDAKNAAHKEAREQLRTWTVLADALARDEQERRLREARQSNPSLTRSAFERSQRDQQRQQPTREQRLETERQQGERTLENQKQRLTQQAASGDADATCQLAQAYLYGRGYPVDEAKGNALMKEAAQLGDIAAKLYLQKNGPPMNAEQTKQWLSAAKAEVARLQKESTGGSAKAKRQLAKAYLFGYGVDPDPGKAGSLMKEAVQMDSNK